ncbi:MAG: sigma-70 family RNA polymerase sigma factor [bacterium]|nr:sigma-70 family RNA polymerase sigma factor [bacterium]
MEETLVNDAVYIERCLRGDREGFSEIIRRYQSLVCAVTYNVTGSVDASEELAQETFVAAWNNLARIHDPAKLRPWLCGIARNLCNDWLRKRRRQSEALKSIPPGESPAAASPAALSTPFERALNREEESLLWKAIEDIPPLYREPLILFYRDQQSVEAVAEALELTPDAVKQRLHRGRAMLKAQVAAFVEETLSRSGPGGFFAGAVLAALPAAIPQTAAAGLAAASAKGSSGAKLAAAFAVSGAMLGVILGSLGLAGGFLIGYQSLKHPDEKRMYLRHVAGYTAYIFAFWALLFAFAGRLRPWLESIAPENAGQLMVLAITANTMVFTTGLMLLIVRGNARLVALQKELGTWRDPAEAQRDALLEPWPAAKTWGVYLGSALATVSWILPTAAIAHDALTLVWVVPGALAIGGAAAWIKTRRTDRSLKPLFWMFAALGALNLLAVNLRWSVWQAPVFEDIPLWAMDLLIVMAVLFAGWALYDTRAKIEKLLKENR